MPGMSWDVGYQRWRSPAYNVRPHTASVRPWAASRNTHRSVTLQACVKRRSRDATVANLVLTVSNHCLLFVCFAVFSRQSRPGVSLQLRVSSRCTVFIPVSDWSYIPHCSIAHLQIIPSIYLTLKSYTKYTKTRTNEKNKIIIIIII